MKCLVNVNSEKAQDYVFKKYGVNVPMYMVINVKTLHINSDMYFEMWEPSNTYINI